MKRPRSVRCLKIADLEGSLKRFSLFSEIICVLLPFIDEEPSMTADRNQLETRLAH